MYMQTKNKAQGAIEYLLIIGAAILVVAIVILAVNGALGTGTKANESATEGVSGALDNLKNLAGTPSCHETISLTCAMLTDVDQTTCELIGCSWISPSTCSGTPNKGCSDLASSKEECETDPLKDPLGCAWS